VIHPSFTCHTIQLAELMGCVDLPHNILHVNKCLNYIQGHRFCLWGSDGILELKDVWKEQYGFSHVLLPQMVTHKPQDIPVGIQSEERMFHLFKRSWRVEVDFKNRIVKADW
jgi:hypothetical protein